MKVCATCKVPKDTSDFGIDKSNKDGHSYHCKKCRSEKEAKWRKDNPEGQKQRTNKYREKRKEFYDSEKGIISSRKAHLKRTYGITLEEYNQKLSNQDSRCAICNGIETHDKHKVLAVDHCHKTGQVRKLLCYKCNTGLGSFNDDTNLLQKAIEYLKLFKKD